jgi:hypothetical protein
MNLGEAPKVRITPPRLLNFSSQRQEFEYRKSELNSERQEYLEEWRDISEYIQLRLGRYLVGNGKKRRRSKNVLNEKGTFASRTCGAGMLAGVSSPSRPWLKLKTSNPALNESQEAKMWFNIAERMLYEVFASSNYYHIKQQSYRDMADFGQGPVLIDEDYENVINNYCSPPGEYYLGVDRRGVVDTMYRDMERTTLQLVEEFQGNIPREVRYAYDTGDYQRPWKIVGVDQPNVRRIQGARGPNGMVYTKIYYCLDVADQGGNAILGVGGANENPISAPRWDLQPGDTYGDGPGSLVLPIVKSLQVLERRKGQMVDKMAAPATQSPASMKKAKFGVNHMPGANSYYPDIAAAGGGGQPIRPIYEIQGTQLQAVQGEEYILEQRIDVGYFVNLFLATLESDRRQVTATEIAERHEEKLIALGPVLERTHYEGLNHDVKRAFGILLRHRVLPPPPPVLDGLQLEVEYISLLATAQRAIGAGPIERFAGFLGNLAAGNPEILDKWDMDQTVDEYGDVVGVPASMVRSDDKVAEIRSARAKQTQQAQAMETAAMGADTAAVLSKADTGRDSNLLADILGGGPQRLI